MATLGEAGKLTISARLFVFFIQRERVFIAHDLIFQRGLLHGLGSDLLATTARAHRKTKGV